MSPEEIIKEKSSYPHLEQIKIKDTEEYRRITEKIILDKLSNVLPHYVSWQKRNHEFPEYESTLLNINEVISSFNYSKYDEGLSGKKELTHEFFVRCSPYRYEDIVKVADEFDKDTSLKIKNLVNRCFKKHYNDRQRIISNIKKYVDQKCDHNIWLPLVNYAPFQNPTIGVEWLKRREVSSVSVQSLYWIILLCIDLKFFSPKTFIPYLIDSIGQENTDLLVERLAIFLATLPCKKTIFTPIEKCLSEKVAKYRDIMINCKIIHIPLRNLQVVSKYIKYQDFKYLLPCILRTTEKELLKNSLNTEEEISIIIPLTFDKNRPYFKFLFKKDEERILNKIIEIRTGKDSTTQKSNKDYVIKVNNEGCSKATDNAKVKYNPIIASNIPASMLKIRKNVIEFLSPEKQRYFFRSVKISEKISLSTLEKINHRFTLVKDIPVINGAKRELRFVFEPANDFSLLLAEIERHSKNEDIISDDGFPQTGEFDLPWRFIRFYEGILMLYHPNPSKRGTMTPFYFRHSDIHKTFEDIRPYIENKCEKLRVAAADGVIISLLNFKEFMSCISQYKDWEEEENIGFGEPLYKLKKTSFAKETFSRNCIVRKSPYLSYLATIQHDDFKIIYLLERKIHESGLFETEEYGYLFVIKKSYNKMILLYENISDSSRSSIIFYINPEYYLDSVRVITKFFASDINNKRLKFAHGKIRFNVHYILKTRRIKHTDFIDWKYNIKQICNEC